MSDVWVPRFTESQASEWAEYAEDVREAALRSAVSTLTTLTNNRVGTPPITVRPLPEEGLGATCGCVGGSRATTAGEVALEGPVGFVDYVKVDGEFLDLDDFRLDDGHILVWQGDGPSPIPAAQDLSKPDTDPGTWSVSYSRSYPVSEEGQTALARLALEMASAYAPSRGRQCNLPKGVQNVTRQGVSFVIEAGLFPGGLTGIELVDIFILKWVPVGFLGNRSAQVFSPRRLKTQRVASSLPRRMSRGSI